jgi:hypothetical protein
MSEKALRTLGLHIDVCRLEARFVDQLKYSFLKVWDLCSTRDLNQGSGSLVLSPFGGLAERKILVQVL